MFGLFKKQKNTDEVKLKLNYRVVEKTEELKVQARSITLSTADGQVYSYISKSQVHNYGYTDTYNLITGGSIGLSYGCSVPSYAIANLDTKSFLAPPHVPNGHTDMLMIIDVDGFQQYVNMNHVVSIIANPLYDTGETVTIKYSELERIPE